MTRQFDVAYSFAGEQRDDVVRLDAALQAHFPVARLFYDRRHEAALAGADLDAKLCTIYREQAELVVVLISANYARKNWTNAEGRAIRDLILQQEGERVVLLRFDHTPVRPIPDTAHFVDWHVTPLEQIVAHIVERHARIIADPPGPTDTRTPPLTRPRCKEFTTIGTLFKGREEAMARLRESLRKETAHATAIVAHQTIHGEGGVGKSRLAIEFGLAHRTEYSALLFVQADSPAALQANLANLAGPLVLNLPLPPDADINVKLAAVLRWLDTHPGWFLILDNVDTEEAARAVEDELARLRAGHVVITSRVSAWSEAVTPLELDVLDENDAVAFLLEATAPHGTQGRSLRDDDEVHARLLARDVDGLALALEQSAAYIRTTGTTIEKYRARWAAFDEKVRGWHDERLIKYPRSVATTWNASFDALPDGAATLLRVCSLMAHAPVPVELLEHATADLDEALAPLLRFSLARREGDDVRVHRLIQEVVERRMRDEERMSVLLIAGHAMNEIIPEESPHTNIASWPLWERLALHVPTLVEEMKTEEFGSIGRILNEFGQYLGTQARNAEAEPLMRRFVDIVETSYGNDHPNVAIRLNNLAICCETQTGSTTPSCFQNGNLKSS